MNAHSVAKRQAEVRDLPQELGVVLEHVSAEGAQARMLAGEGHTTAGGSRVHGGVLMALADTVAASAVARHIPAGTWTTTVDSHTHFVHTASAGPLKAVARAVNKSRSSQLWETMVYDCEGRLVSVTLQTQLVMKSEQATSGAPETVLDVVAPAAKMESLQSVPEQRRRRIFEAASAVFGRKGYGGASVRDIAEEAQMPISTMYLYVRGKADILRLVFETYMGEIAHALDVAADRRKPPRQRLKDAIEANLRLYDTYRHQIRLMYQETHSLSGDNRERVLDLTRAANRVWEEIIAEGVTSGDFRCSCPDVTANLIPMMCATWVLRRWNIQRASLDEVVTAITELVFSGLTDAEPSQ